MTRFGGFAAVGFRARGEEMDMTPPVGNNRKQLVGCRA
jgi:hypothetical protein